MHRFFVHHDALLPSGAHLQLLQTSRKAFDGSQWKVGLSYSCCETTRGAVEEAKLTLFVRHPRSVQAATPESFFLIKFQTFFITSRTSPVSLQKQVLQSCFHDVPGVHSVVVRLILGLSFCPRQNIIVHTATPLSASPFKSKIQSNRWRKMILRQKFYLCRNNCCIRRSNL